jgi:hypothetical protein
MLDLFEPVYWWADRLAPTLMVHVTRRKDDGRPVVLMGDADAPFALTADEAREIGQALIGASVVAASTSSGRSDA